MWAENYDREVADVFTAQREIAESVASELNAALSPGEKNALEQQPTKDLEAYDMDLQARALFHPFGVTAKTGEEKLPKAEQFLQAAIRATLASCPRIACSAKCRPRPPGPKINRPTKGQNRRRRCNTRSRSRRTPAKFISRSRGTTITHWSFDILLRPTSCALS